MLDMVASTGLALANSAANIYMQRKTNEANSAEAEKNRQFQAQQSGTTYSRAAEDMRKAGLNPLLAGGGATSPAASGSTATHGAARLDDFSSIPFSAASTDISRKQQADAEKTAQDQRELLDLQKTSESNNAKLIAENTAKAIHERDLLGVEKASAQKQYQQDIANDVFDERAKAEKQTLRAQTQQAKFAEKQSAFENKHSSTLVPINTVSGVAGSILSPIHSAKQLFSPISTRRTSNGR